MELRNASDHPPDALRVFDLDPVHRLQPHDTALARGSTCNFAEMPPQRHISRSMLVPFCSGLCTRRPMQRVSRNAPLIALPAPSTCQTSPRGAGNPHFTELQMASRLMSLSGASFARSVPVASRVPRRQVHWMRCRHRLSNPCRSRLVRGNPTNCRDPSNDGAMDVSATAGSQGADRSRSRRNLCEV